ncbi:MAG TPA: vWA domain-containing protein [Chitinophagaceae bacterium]
MKKESASFNMQELKALAVRKISEKAGSKYVAAAEPEKDELSNGETVFLFRGYDTGDANGKSYEIVLDSKGAELSMDELSKTEKRSLFLPAITEINKELLLPFAVASEHITISPTKNELTLKECDRFDEEIIVTIPKDSKRKIDIYFLADTTGSMTSILNAVKAGANNILNAVIGTGNDVAFGVGNYRDFTDPPPHPFQHQLNPTTNGAAVAAAINTWTAAGGGDLPEAQLFALKNLAQPPGGAIGWRPDSKRIIVWFGDAPGHDPSGGATLASVIAGLTAEKISVIAISVSPNQLNATGQATAITAATGGSFQSGINAANIVNTIITMINNLVSVINNVSLVAAGATAPFVTSITPAGGYGPLKGDTAHVLKFKVTFTGVKPCDDKDQIYHGTLNVVADGTVVAQKKVEIKVPACCKKRRYSYSVKYVIGIQEREECNIKLPVNTGNYTTEINIHNYQNKEAVIEKHIVPVIHKGESIGREPRYARIVANDKIVLPPHTATMDDTYRLAELLYNHNPQCRIPLNIGFLHIISNIKLSVTAVYTAANLKEGGIPSIAVEEITEREIPLEDFHTHGLL